MQGDLDVGDRVFFNHPEDSWVIGTVRGITGGLKVCETEDGVVCKTEEAYKVVESSLEDHHDLRKMSYLHDSTLLYHIRKRYFNNVIYTNIGDIVLAMNPFDYNLPLYTDDKMINYISEGADVLVHGSQQVPHSWSVAHRAYCMMRSKQENQSILVSGESGAGKTEAVKIVMRYVGELSTAAATSDQRDHARAINTKVSNTSPILESFGNAKTTRNDNSSRFGKFMRMKFNCDGVLIGAYIEPYLLERSRVITHAQGERGFHSFYQLVAGASGDDKRRMRLGKLTDYACLNAGSVGAVAGVDDAEEYHTTRDAMTIVGISEDDQRSLFNVLAAVLHLMNINFLEREGRSCLNPADTEIVTFVAEELLCINPDDLLTEMTSTTRTVAGDTYTTALDKTFATEQRDTLCKTLYERVFLWLVAKINELIDCPTDDSDHWLGLLDIFGFEHFETNSFEQLCINLTNEQLQNHYNNYTFTKDMQECQDEGINTQNIIFADNQPTLDLITSTLGVLSLLDEEVQLRKGSDASFAAKLNEAQGSHPSYVKHRMNRQSFGVRHYAGTVMYTVEGWRDKNMDTLKDQLKLLMRTSTNTFISGLIELPPPPETVRRKPTVSRIYKGQLQELMGIINSSNPHWIRCIKPHHSKKPRMFHGQEVMSQLRSAGVLETVRIRKMGYSVRLPFEHFIARYRTLAGTGGKARDICQAVLDKLEIRLDMGQVGKTKVFLKTEAWMTIEDARVCALNSKAVTVQRFSYWRRSNERCAVQLAKKRVKLVQAFVRSKLSMKHVKYVEYKSREEILVSGAAKLQACIREEERNRVALMQMEVDYLHSFGECKRKHLEGIVEKWYKDKPMRDALLQSDFKVQEETERMAMEREEQEQLLYTLDLLKDDFSVMQQRQVQRERLEDEQRIRLQEQMLLEQRQKAQLAWARAMDEKRLAEELILQEEYRKWQQIQKVSDTINQAKELYHQERSLAVKERRRFEQETFCSSVPPHRIESPRRTRSRSPSFYRRQQSMEPPPSYATPTFSRVSMTGSATAGQMYSAVPSQSRAQPMKRPGRSPNPPKPVKADPNGTHSLDMVKKLQKLSKAVQSNPYRLITQRYPPLSTRSPNNPNHPDWHPAPDGSFILPDGSKYVGLWGG
eukprot:TRINITY_DN14549_c0_g1_i2.p1 TRINITY_DN14549_c0_g1~~TRINITY_DN14549_c0_g1_i2.p1  ORF type:complete len:1164 (+),score=365.61 TRINITY_DN14549_c0_g1_i2:90-3494(+)